MTGRPVRILDTDSKEETEEKVEDFVTGVFDGRGRERAAALAADSSDEGERESVPEEWEGDIDADALPDLPGVQVSMLAEHPEMDEHARLVEDAVVGMATGILDKAGVGEFAAKMKLKRESVTKGGVIIEEVWSIAVTARPAKAK